MSGIVTWRTYPAEEPTPGEALARFLYDRIVAGPDGCVCAACVRDRRVDALRAAVPGMAEDCARGAAAKETP